MDFAQRKILVDNEQRRELAINLIRNLPLGVEVVARKPVKVRTLDQNALYHSGPLNDIAEQAWIQGRRYSKETLHEYFKDEFLPDDSDPDLASLVKNPDTYRKYDTTPKRDLVLVGSTTELTTKGFSQFLEQVYAFGSELGVMFTAR